MTEEALTLLRVERTLDRYLGADAHHGTGEGTAADVELLGQQRDEARAELARWRAADQAGFRAVVESTHYTDAVAEVLRDEAAEHPGPGCFEPDREAECFLTHVHRAHADHGVIRTVTASPERLAATAAAVLRRLLHYPTTTEESTP